MAAPRLRIIGQHEMTPAIGAIDFALRAEVEINRRMAQGAAVTGDSGLINGNGIWVLHGYSVSLAVS
jgi:hypothetical protein